MLSKGATAHGLPDSNGYPGEALCPACAGVGVDSRCRCRFLGVCREPQMALKKSNVFFFLFRK